MENKTDLIMDDDWVDQQPLSPVSPDDMSTTHCTSDQEYYTTMIMNTVDESAPISDEHYKIANNFANEHRIYLKALLDLVQERDKQAPEVGMMDPVIFKAGPLKKASHLMNGVWKNKYVEIRRGMFSYFENSGSEGDLKRKDIPLQAESCRCRPVRLHQKALKMAPGGAIFELYANNTKRLWMAKSREERQVWIQAISNAIVGKSLTQSDETEIGRRHRSPFRNDIRRYNKLRHTLRNAKSKREYLVDLAECKILRAPVKWIAKQIESEESAFREETVELSVEQLWRDLQRDSVLINGELYRGDSFHGPEQIMGAVARHLLSFAKQGNISSMNESQAFSYARDILLSGNRTRSGGDSYYCVKTLCGNSDLVVVTPSAVEVEPVSILVSLDESEEARDLMCDMSGWVRSKNRTQRSWQKLFFVLSEGTLTYYEEALPRPHRLRGQMVLADASISISKTETVKTEDDDHHQQSQQHYILTISTKEGTSSKERSLIFDSEARLLDWTYALERMSKSGTQKRHRRRASRADPQKQEGEDNATGAGMAEKATKGHGELLGLDSVFVDDRLAFYQRKSYVILKIDIQATSSYNICTLDPQGDEKEDVWASIRAIFTQTFRITGGSNGRLIRGEEVVRITVENELTEELLVPDFDPEVLPSSPSQRRRKMSGMFRSMGSANSTDFIEEIPIDRPSQSM